MAIFDFLISPFTFLTSNFASRLPHTSFSINPWTSVYILLFWNLIFLPSLSTRLGTQSSVSVSTETLHKLQRDNAPSLCVSLSLALSCYICTNLTSHADESLPVVDYSNNQAWFYTNSHPVHEPTLPLFRVITSLVRLSQPSHCLQRPQILLLLSPHTSPQFGDFYTERWTLSCSSSQFLVFRNANWIYQVLSSLQRAAFDVLFRLFTHQ